MEVRPRLLRTGRICYSSSLEKGIVLIDCSAAFSFALNELSWTFDNSFVSDCEVKERLHDLHIFRCCIWSYTPTRFWCPGTKEDVSLRRRIIFKKIKKGMKKKWYSGCRTLQTRLCCR